MLRNYFSRIISQAIRKLLFPELVEIRSELAKINARAESKAADRVEPEPHNTSVADMQVLTKKMEEKFSEIISSYTSAVEKRNAEAEKNIVNIILEKISEINALAQEIDKKHGAEVTELREITENNFDRFFKRDISHSSKISDLWDFTEKNLGELQSEIKKTSSMFEDDMKKFNKRLDDLYKVIVKREEHSFMVNDVQKLRQEVELLKREAMNNN